MASLVGTGSLPLPTLHRPVEAQYSLESDIMSSCWHWGWRFLVLIIFSPESRAEQYTCACHPYQEPALALGGTHWLTKHNLFCKHPARVHQSLDPKLSFSQC